MKTRSCLALLVILLLSSSLVLGATTGIVFASAAQLSGAGGASVVPIQLLPDEPQSHNLIPDGGEVWYEVNSVPGYVFGVTLELSGGLPMLDLSLCDQTGNVLYMLTVDEESGTNTVRLLWLAEQASYLVHVQYAGSPTPVAYDISFGQAPDEANNARDDAFSFEMFGTPFAGTMNEQQDVDWFRIPIQPGRYYYLQLYHASSMGVLVDLLGGDGELLMSGQRMSSGAWLCFHPTELSEVFLRLSHVPGTSLGMYDTLLCYDYPDVIDVTCGELVQEGDAVSVTVTVVAGEAAKSSSEDDKRYLYAQLNRPSGQPWMGEVRYSVDGGESQTATTDINGYITIPVEGLVWGDGSPALGSGQQITISASLEPGDYTLNVITIDRFISPIDMVSRALHVPSQAELAAKAAADAIAVLPEPGQLTLDDKPAVLAARQLVVAAFALGVGEQEVANLPKLLMAEARIALLEHPPVADDPVEEIVLQPLQLTVQRQLDGSLRTVHTATAAARSLISQARRAGQECVEFSIGAIASQQARRVIIPNELLRESAGLGVIIRSGACMLELPSTLVQTLAQSGQGVAVDMTLGDEATVAAAMDGTYQPVASPLQIDTMMQGNIVVTLLCNIALPADQEDRQALLDNLAMLAVHESDVELVRELTFTFSEDGMSLVAVGFLVQRFSTFCLVEIDPVALSAKRAVLAIDALPSIGELTLGHAAVLEAARGSVTNAFRLGVGESAIPNIASLVERERRLAQLAAASGTLRIGLRDSGYTLNGSEQPFPGETAVSIGDGAVGIALRLLEQLGANVTYRKVEQRGEIQIAFLDTVLTLWDGSGQMAVRDSQGETLVPLSAVVCSRHGRCYVPIRDLGRYLGLRVEWHGNEKSVTISGK